jgi:hypothetical protein
LSISNTLRKKCTPRQILCMKNCGLRESKP